MELHTVMDRTNHRTPYFPVSLNSNHHTSRLNSVHNLDNLLLHQGKCFVTNQTPFLYIVKAGKSRHYSRLGAPETPPPLAGCAPLATPCVDSKYRTLDGTCNNLRYPTWGAANTKYGRLVPPKYADGRVPIEIHKSPRYRSE